MQEEIFLPVEQSGRERSIIEVLDEMMASLELPFAQKRAAQLKIKKGKHSGSVVPSEAERKMCGLSDVDIPATIRTCVERGSHMEKDGLQGQIMPEDLRMKRYRNKKHSTVLFVVDASRSQGANKRLAFAKSAVMAMLEKAYCDRDRVGLILFGDKHATEAAIYKERGCRGREHAGAESKGQYTTCDGAAFGRTGTVDGSPQISRGYPSHCADYGWQVQL